MTGNTVTLSTAQPYARRVSRGAARTGLILLLATSLLPGGLLLGAPLASAAPIDEAKAAAAAGKWADAAAAYAKVLDKQPANKAAAIGLTRTSIKATLPDLYQQAEDALRTLNEKNDKDVAVLVALGRICLATSAAKKDTLAKKSYDVEAQQSFQRALRLSPGSDGAAAGLAQTYYQMGDFAQAIKTVDDFVAAKPKAPSRALFWKGQTLYIQALDAYRAGGNKLTAEAKSLFGKAQGAYQASTMADGGESDAWIQLAYASAYLGATAEAEGAYRKAAVLDPNNQAPITGLKSLFTYTKGKFAKEMAALLEKNPEHPWALWHYGVDRYTAKDWDTATDLFRRFAAVTTGSSAADGFYYAGICADQGGDAKAAEKDWFKALQASPSHANAAAEISKKLMASGAEVRTRKSVKAAKQVIAEFGPLLKAAPEMAWIRNNLAFMLREGYVASRESPEWKPILKESTRLYTEAAEILGEWTHEKEQGYDWATRYGEAQIISDCGLMYQFYEPTRDYAVAERYYRIALEYTENGYRDAFINLSRILAEEKRWQELYELCADCADGITTEAGDADTPVRAHARKTMKELLDSGKAKDE